MIDNITLFKQFIQIILIYCFLFKMFVIFALTFAFVITNLSTMLQFHISLVTL